MTSRIRCEEIEYGGWARCLRLANDVAELVVTLEVGPRVLRLAFRDGDNLFKEFADHAGQTGGDEWKSYGGHRLWHAPEVVPRTYFPDNRPVAHDFDGASLVLTPPPEEANGLQLSMAITLDPIDALVTVYHRIENVGPWDVELAPWCLSVMDAGGRAILPQEEFIPHPDCLVPARPLVLWHFARMDDPRFVWGDRYVQMRQDDAHPSKQKIGARNSLGWAAYVRGDEVFVKRFAHDAAATYPDFGCNCELYTEPGFLEVETLGPLIRLAPGAGVTHAERWGLFRAAVGETEESIATHLLPLVERTPPIP